MKSILEANALDDFIAMAEMGDEDFDVHRITRDNPLNIDEFAAPQIVLTPADDSQSRSQILTIDSFEQFQLSIPRKPAWTKEMTAEEIDRREKDAFLNWRRQISYQELISSGKKVTPFEKNIEVWRQLWRVCERSHIIIQVVDARNPLLYYTANLKEYIKELSPPRKMLLLVNKSDLLSEFQRRCWAKCFEKLGLNYIFYSAYFSQSILDNSDGSNTLSPLDISTTAIEFKAFFDAWFAENDENNKTQKTEKETTFVWGDNEYETTGTGSSQKVKVLKDENENIEKGDLTSLDSIAASSCRVVTREELLGILNFLAKDLLVNDPLAHEHNKNSYKRATVGMIGYPNVGKSSLINTLLGVTKANHGKARVGVSSTPGKTKHFQTLNLSDWLVLCDCPGLVFPSFMNTTGEMLTSGMLPINQMRDYVEPARLIAERIPIHLLNATYGMKIKREIDVMDNPNRPPTPSEMLFAYCKIKGYITGGTGRWDEFRACKEILRDFNDGVLLYVAVPPHIKGLDNEEIRKRWIFETERTLTQRKKIANRLIEGKKLEAVVEETAIEAEKEIAEKAIELEKQEIDESAGLVDGVYEFIDTNNELADYNIENLEGALEMLEGMNLDGQEAPQKREHKRLKTWGKKGRKLRNKDPYGEDASPEAYMAFYTNRNIIGGGSSAIRSNRPQRTN